MKRLLMLIVLLHFLAYPCSVAQAHMAVSNDWEFSLVHWRDVLPARIMWMENAKKHLGEITEVESREYIEEFLDAWENMSAFVGNRKYQLEMAPVLIACLRQKSDHPVLMHPTKLQARLLANKNFSGLVMAVQKELDSDENELLQRQSNVLALLAMIESTKKEPESLSYEPKRRE